MPTSGVSQCGEFKLVTACYQFAEKSFYRLLQLTDCHLLAEPEAGHRSDEWRGCHAVASCGVGWGDATGRAETPRVPASAQHQSGWTGIGEEGARDTGAG